jgi:hypothetical protein
MSHFFSFKIGVKCARDSCDFRNTLSSNQISHL